METCPVKTVISGGMGFALGGAFGLFMSSVRDAEPQIWRCYTLANIASPFSDELRHPLKCVRPTAHGPAVAGTTTKRLQRYGVAIVQFCQKFWLSGRHIRWDRVLHRRRAL